MDYLFDLEQCKEIETTVRKAYKSANANFLEDFGNELYRLMKPCLEAEQRLNKSYNIMGGSSWGFHLASKDPNFGLCGADLNVPLETIYGPIFNSVTSELGLQQIEPKLKSFRGKKDICPGCFSELLRLKDMVNHDLCR